MGVANVIGVWQVTGGNAGCGNNKMVIVGVAKGIGGNGRCGLFKIHVVAGNLWMYEICIFGTSFGELHGSYFWC